MLRYFLSPTRTLLAGASLLALLPAAFAAPKTATPPRPKITGIASIVLAAQSMQADKTFYTHTLGWAAVSSPEYPKGMRFYGDPRQTVDVHPASGPNERAFDHVVWATTDADALRRYLRSKGVQVPGSITVLHNGEKTFRVKDPEGYTVEFAQVVPGSDLHGAAAPNSVSGRIIHTGFIVKSVAAEDHFYKDILGFHLYWEGGMKDGELDFVSMQVPDGTDWLEYMLHAGDHPSHHQIGVDDHFSLGVENMDKIVALYQKRGFPPGGQTHKQAGRDGKYQLNFYDPDDVRIEFMEFKPFQTPCCHAFEGKQPGPNQQ